MNFLLRAGIAGAMVLVSLPMPPAYAQIPVQKIQQNQHIKTQPKGIDSMSVAHAHTHAEPKKTYLKDYQVPSHFIDKTDLTFELNDLNDTVVSAKLAVRANPDSKGKPGHLELDGGEELELLELKVNGKALDAKNYHREGDKLILENLPAGSFELETKVCIDPQANTELSGLYVSGGKFTTQCESQGFRHITFAMDRPDVMSEYTTTIIGDKSKFKHMLSNGNEVASGKTADGRDFTTWHDPSLKPSYLFALVAGDLDVRRDTFTTQSGKVVDLSIFVDKGQNAKSEFAMQALKDAMKWDEEKYGREYDLKNYMIVAVDDFNFGAMENKGLNIFNSSAILADPETATDARYERIRQVVGHEYFHNWSGNRVTVRDWFQVSLKEGFTNYRDQTFNSDMGNADATRIADVATFRATQFPEDAGPMAHPIRPDSFVTIENFYTTTVYEKGSEVIGMMRTIIGDENFRKGTDLYFERNDGKAVTTEDFVKALSDASGVDLTQFEKTWYNQAGTPTLTFTDSYDPKTKTYSLTVEQNTPPTPGQPKKDPFHIPVRLGLLDKEGNDMPLKVQGDDGTVLTNGNVLNVKQPKQTFVFENVEEKPLPSLVRGFSAPVKVKYDYSRDDLTFLLSHDNDGFNRWEAAQNLGVAIIKDQVKAIQEGRYEPVDARLVEAFRSVAKDPTLDKEVKAALLSLPGESYVAELYPAGQVDVLAIHDARNKVSKTIANELEGEFKALYDANLSAANKPYAFSDADVAERAIRNTSLAYLMKSDHKEKYLPAVKKHFYTGNNMTDVATSLSLIVNYADKETREAALDDFYKKWKDDKLVMNQWLGVQASADRDDVLDTVKALTKHPAFDVKNPNKIRALLGGFGANTAHFHAKDGSGYTFMADKVLEIDAINPMTAAGLVKPLTSAYKFNGEQREMMKAQLQRIARHSGLSPNVNEVVSSTLKMMNEQEANPKWGDRVKTGAKGASLQR